MRPFVPGRVPAALLLVALSAPLGAQSFAWWKNDEFKKEVGLTADQCARIDTVFQATIPKLRTGREELDHLEAELSKMIDTNAEEAQVVRQVDKVEATRASLNKMRTLMLLHERQVLTPDQRVKLNKLHEQWVKDHKTSPRDAKK